MVQSIQESLVKHPTPKTPVPVIDYAKIASLIPKPATPPAAVNVNKVVRLTTEEIEKKDNLMIYGLRPFHPHSPEGAQEGVIQLRVSMHALIDSLKHVE